MPARPSNATKVTCSKCGAVDTYGGMLKRIEDKVVKHIKRKLRSIPK
ncbi:ECs_2282 family putative zinc-binding protein [Pseudomonas grimontii]